MQQTHTLKTRKQTQQATHLIVDTFQMCTRRYLSTITRPIMSWMAWWSKNRGIMLHATDTTIPPFLLLGKETIESAPFKATSLRKMTHKVMWTFLNHIICFIKTTIQSYNDFMPLLLNFLKLFMETILLLPSSIKNYLKLVILSLEHSNHQATQCFQYYYCLD